MCVLGFFFVKGGEGLCFFLGGRGGPQSVQFPRPLDHLVRGGGWWCRSGKKTLNAWRAGRERWEFATVGILTQLDWEQNARSLSK